MRSNIDQLKSWRFDEKKSYTYSNTNRNLIWNIFSSNCSETKRFLRSYPISRHLILYEKEHLEQTTNVLSLYDRKLLLFSFTTMNILPTSIKFSLAEKKGTFILYIYSLKKNKRYITLFFDNKNWITSSAAAPRKK